MDTRQAASEFAALFPQVYRRFCRRTQVTNYRPTPEATAVLLHLAESGPLTVTEAARHMLRSQATMSEILARLIKRGLLSRVRDQRDRRRTLVWLTLAGERVLDESRQILSPQLLARAMRDLTPEQRRRLVRSIEALLLAAQQTKGNQT
ncbi:MAG: MarR family transcriptional regulator [Phycisphaerae bacterium]|nr:MarR family transcriptional regulator [Phycisphaerae bacterium]